MTIEGISDARLKNDLIESYDDIMNCTLALSEGITESCGKKIADRIETNKAIIKTIKKEILRRAKENGKA